MIKRTGIVILICTALLLLADCMGAKGKEREPAVAPGSGNPAEVSIAGGADAPPGLVDGVYRKPSKDTLKQRLTQTQYIVTQENGTELPYINEYVDNHEDGIYVDIVSGEPLFTSRDKFESGTGWPSFTKPMVPGNVLGRQDTSEGMIRTEVRSRYADSHLGHVFDDGPAPTGLRYCINSAALRFIPLKDLEREGYGKYVEQVTGIAAPAGAMERKNSVFPDPPVEMSVKPGTTRVAVFAGGCFWGVEGVFEKLYGVQDVVSGYAGGSEENAHYDLVGTGTTGHAESVRITYDPGVISFGTLLKIFFAVAHDPTQLNYQGPDVGTQYRSVVFYTDDVQQQITWEYIKILTAAKQFKQPVVTQVLPLVAFYPAEDYHQDFLRRNPDYPYIVYWDLPKIKHLEEEFPALVAKS